MSTNFFERQRDLRRMSIRLVLLFSIAVLTIIAIVDLVALIALGALSPRDDPGRFWSILGVTSLATAGAIGLATLYRMATLRGGGGRVARELGGDYVPQDTTDPQLRRLRNIVEEISIASGVPVPEIYVLQHEAAINAFAAGWSTSDAAIAVTRGALERLNRDELQGVIAHEFSHVINGDMRLNIRLIGLLFGILFLTIAGETILRGGMFSRSRDENSGGNPLPLIGIALIVAGFAGVVIGRVIKASVSRKREYLADASAVQFTRQTSGLAGALKKIAGLPVGSGLQSPKSEEVGHMLFGSGARKRQSLLATHPPLPDRIKALDPSFDIAQLTALSQQWAQRPPVGLQEDLALGLTDRHLVPPASPDPTAPGLVAAGLTTAGLTTAGLTTAGAGPIDIVHRIAAPTDSEYARAAELIDRIPAELLAKVRGVEYVEPVVLGLLMSTDPEVSGRQLADLSRIFGDDVAHAVLTEAQGLAGIPPELRLPLAELAFPALRHRSDVERQAFLDAVDALIHADGRITIFEYCLSTLLRNDLYQSLYPPPHRHSETRPLHKCQNEVVTLLSVLATDEAAYRVGMDMALPENWQPYQTRQVTDLDPVWHVLRELRPEGKELLLRAVVEVIDYDRTLVVDEMELLRTVCGLLHCPMPPLVHIGA